MESWDLITEKPSLSTLTERQHSLKSPADWPRWEQNIKEWLKLWDVWKYCDPSSPVCDLPVLEEPVAPDITTVKPHAKSILDLEPHHFDELAILVSHYKQGKRIFDTKMKRLDEIARVVWVRVDTKYRDYLDDLSPDMRYGSLTVWKQLRQLSDIIEPVTQQTLDRLQEEWDLGPKTYLKNNIESIQPEIDREQFYDFCQSFFKKCKAIGLVSPQFSPDKILFKLGCYYESPLTCRRVEMKHFVLMSLPVSWKNLNDASQEDILQGSDSGNKEESSEDPVNDDWSAQWPTKESPEWLVLNRHGRASSTW
jgi:hypothetical protein